MLANNHACWSYKDYNTSLKRHRVYDCQHKNIWDFFTSWVVVVWFDDQLSPGLSFGLRWWWHYKQGSADSENHNNTLLTQSSSEHTNDTEELSEDNDVISWSNSTLLKNTFEHFRFINLTDNISCLQSEKIQNTKYKTLVALQRLSFTVTWMVVIMQEICYECYLGSW